ncbi:probable anion transporter 3, chloroplastic [Dioscorea cayenensis subsp. rotundata]|uniref:Probable anion transporter 3, chloroplastic n=1 Tax=Dioscorea cayennensis subsp. rotundata TaxID=55577 RepID=A0AB40CYR5_DIOCR|nr:probable anion transporter 3, chloroplastic [Dioscorea cayenensis subsp. rotundata]
MEVVSPTPAKSVLPSHSSHCSRPSSFSSSSSSWISSPYNISNGSIGSSNSRHGGSRLRIISRICDRVPWKNQGGTCSSSSTSSGSSACNGNGGFGFVLGERVEEKRRREKAARVVICGAGAGGIGREEEAIRIPERAKVVALVSLVMCLCNADRVVMSVAVVPLAAKYGWSSSFLGIVQSSFLWGYLFSSVAGGALADRYGGKRVMAWGVALWSLATFLTPWAADHSTAMLLAVRALFGLAEGVALPSMNTLLSRWFPCHERASAVGLSMAGFHLGNVISFLATPVIMSSIGLAGAFSLFASLGFMWLSLWVNGVTNDPGDSPLISTYELQLIRAGKTDVSSSSGSKFPPLRHLLSKLPTWAIIFANVTNNWGYFVLLSWMPVYFKTVYNVNLKQAAWFSAVPWGMMAISGYIAGAASDSLIASGYPVTRVRKIMQSIGFIGPALALLCLKYAQTPNAAAFLMTVALSFSSFSQAGFLLNMQDIAPRYAGFLHGITNSVGTLAAIISTIGTGYFVQWLGSFQAFLTLTSALYFITTIFWNLFATGEQVFY